MNYFHFISFLLLINSCLYKSNTNIQNFYCLLGILSYTAYSKPFQIIIDLILFAILVNSFLCNPSFYIFWWTFFVQCEWLNQWLFKFWILLMFLQLLEYYSVVISITHVCNIIILLLSCVWVLEIDTKIRVFIEYFWLDSHLEIMCLDL